MSVEVDLSPLEKRFSDSEKRAKTRLFMSKVMEYCDKYVPKDTGALMDHRRIDEDDILVWEEKYAKAVYNMDHVISANNPNGAPQWFEVAKKNHLQEWIEYAKKECF